MTLLRGRRVVRVALALVVAVSCLFPACGRKAKPQPLWGAAAAALPPGAK